MQDCCKRFGLKEEPQHKKVSKVVTYPSKLAKDVEGEEGRLKP